jgi:hypothetical protein
MLCSSVFQKEEKTHMLLGIYVSRGEGREIEDHPIFLSVSLSLEERVDMF